MSGESDTEVGHKETVLFWTAVLLAMLLMISWLALPNGVQII